VYTERVHPAKVPSFLFAWAMTANVLVSVSKMEFSPCGSQNGSPVRAAAESGLPALFFSLAGSRILAA
jgi:hypothetical protein